MKRSSIALFSVLLSLAFIFSAAAEGAKETPSTTQGAVAGYPLTVIDDSGAELTFEAPPQRIVSLTVFTDDVLVDIIDHDRITIERL